MGSRGKAAETEHSEDKAGRVPVPEPWGAVLVAVPRGHLDIPQQDPEGLRELLVLCRASVVPKTLPSGGQNWSLQKFLTQNCPKRLFSGPVSAWLLLAVAVWVRMGRVGIHTGAESCQTSNETTFWDAHPCSEAGTPPSLILPARSKLRGEAGAVCVPSSSQNH